MSEDTPVVIVEDDPAHRDLIAHLLHSVAPRVRVQIFAVEEADDLQAELAEAAPQGALVLLDRRLGAQDSLKLLAPLRDTRQDLSFVLMSAFLTPEDRADCLSAGACSVFEKPADLNSWRSILIDLLGIDQPQTRAA